MRVEGVSGDFRSYESLFDKVRFPDRVVSNFQALVCAESGHGKSLTTEKICEEAHKLGFTVVVLTEKPGAPFELGFCGFEPSAKYHRDYLVEQGIEPSRKKLKIYHPLTLNPVLKRELPEMNFFSVPIRSLSEQELTVLLEVESKNYAVKILDSVIRKLKPDDGFLDLVWKADRSIRKSSERIKAGKSIPSFDSEFFIPVQSAGTTKNISHIKSNFEPFMDDFMLSDDNCEFRLDWKSILRDQEHYHLFSTAFLRDKKLKYFVVNYLLNQLNEAHEFKRNNVLVVIQEAVVFMPNSSKDVFVIKTAENFSEKLKTMRSNGFSSVADGQSFYGLHESYREGLTDYYIGRLNIMDLERLSKAIRMPPKMKEDVLRLPKNTYYRIGEYNRITMLFPSHAHKEEGQSFFKFYKRFFPERMRSYSHILRLVKNRKDEQMRKAGERKKEVIKDFKKGIEEKERLERLKGSDDKDGVMKEIKAEKDVLKREKMILLFKESRLNVDNGSPVSWSVLGKKFGVSDKTAKSWALKGKDLLSEESVEEDVGVSGLPGTEEEFLELQKNGGMPKY